MTQPCLLTLIAARTHEDTITDWLLGTHDETGFTCFPAFGHGANAHTLSIGERIEGRARCISFQIASESQDAARALVKDLAERLPNQPIRWWISPLLDAGREGTSE